MVKIISVCSGKGGVGKTTIASNLGLAFQKFGRRTVVVDCNFTAAHLSLSFGNYSYPRTLNHFLRGECSLNDALHTHVSGLKIVPASMELDDLMEINVENFKDKLRDAFKDFDIVVLDAAPGLGKEAVIALQAADHVVFVANPYIPSLVDILKSNQLIGRMGGVSPLGVVINRVKNRRHEISMNELGQFVELPVIGSVPEDERVLECSNRKSLVTHSYPYADSSDAIFDIASRLLGVPFKRSSRLVRKLKSMGHSKKDHHHPSYAPYYGMIR